MCSCYFGNIITGQTTRGCKLKPVCKHDLTVMTNDLGIVTIQRMWLIVPNFTGQQTERGIEVTEVVEGNQKGSGSGFFGFIRQTEDAPSDQSVNLIHGITSVIPLFIIPCVVHIQHILQPHSSLPVASYPDHVGGENCFSPPTCPDTRLGLPGTADCGTRSCNKRTIEVFNGKKYLQFWGITAK